MECMISGRLYPPGDGKAETMDGPMETICATLEQKLRTYIAFHEATELLQQALENDEMETAAHLIARREQFMSEIDGLDGRIKDQRQLISSRSDPASVRKVARLFVDLEEALKRILSANHVCDAIAVSRCEGLRKDLGVIRHHEGGRHAYLRKAAGMPKFLNVRT